MKEIKSVLLQVFGYMVWVLGNLKLGVVIGGNLPKGDTQWLGVIFCMTAFYFLMQAGFLHAKLNRILEKLGEKEEEKTL